MFEDKSLLMSDGQTGITTSDASTSYIDAGVKGDSLDGSELWWYARVKTACTSGSSVAYIAVSLQTSADSAFGTSTTLISTAATLVTSFVAGYVIVRAPVPVGMLRYTRTYYTISGEALTGGAFDSTLVQNVDVLLS
jgi:hypothetical protein